MDSSFTRSGYEVSNEIEGAQNDDALQFRETQAPFRTNETLSSLSFSTPPAQRVRSYREAHSSPPGTGDELWLPLDPIECREIANSLNLDFNSAIRLGLLKASGALRATPPSRISIYLGWDVVHLAVGSAIASSAMPRTDWIDFLEDVMDCLTVAVELARTENAPYPSPFFADPPEFLKSELLELLGFIGSEREEMVSVVWKSWIAASGAVRTYFAERLRALPH